MQRVGALKTMRQNLIGGIVFLTPLAARSSLLAHSQIERAERGVMVRIDVGAQTPPSARPEVISDEIIRMTATAADSFSTHKILMLVPGIQKNALWDDAREYESLKSLTLCNTGGPYSGDEIKLAQ